MDILLGIVVISIIVLMAFVLAYILGIIPNIIPKYRISLLNIEELIYRGYAIMVLIFVSVGLFAILKFLGAIALLGISELL
jgi:hypothetical protein